MGSVGATVGRGVIVRLHWGHSREGCHSGVTVGSVTVGLTLEATVGRGVTVGLSGGDSR